MLLAFFGSRSNHGGGLGLSKETAQGLFFENLYEQNFDKLKLIAYAKLKNGPVSEELA